METEHTETVIERAVAYVKDALGMPPGDRTPEVEARPLVRMSPREVGLTSEVVTGIEPDTHTFKSVAELHMESARRDGGE
jgi:hypothetical protein